MSRERSRRTANVFVLAIASLAAATVSAALTQETANLGKPYVEVPLLYATNRVAQNVAGPRESYGSGFSKEVSYGTAVVTIPKEHIVGVVEMPPTSILERRLKMPRRPRDLGRSFGLSSVTPQPAAAFWSLAAKTGFAPGDGVLLFLPGRLLSFNDALFRAAQFSFDLQLRQPTLLYSWPSTGSVLSYLRDHDLAERSLLDVENLLRDLGASSAQRVDVIAVGLSATLIVRSLRDLGDARAAIAGKLRNVVLVAPDMDVKEFTHSVPAIFQIAPKLRLTVYADPSAGDVRISSQLYQGERMGGLRSAPLRLPGLDFIYVGNQDQGLYGEGQTMKVLADLFSLLTKDMPPELRMLERENGAAGTTWRIR